MSSGDPVLDAGPMPAPPEEGPTWHRLNAWMIIVRPIHEIVGAIPVLVLLLVTGDGEFWRIVWPLAIIGVFMLRGLVLWWRTSYLIEPDQVQLHTGLLATKRLTLRRERIRTVETTTKFGHRMFGLAEVRIGTGQNQQTRSHRAPFSLDAVTRDEAERLRTELLRRTSRADTAEADSGADAAQHAEPERTIRVLDRSWLRFAPLTLSGLATIGVLVGAAGRLLNEAHIAPDDIGAVADVVTWIHDTPIAVTIAAGVGVIVVLATLFSLVGYVLQFWNYRLSREPDGALRVRRGLFTTRSLSIEHERLQGVQLREQLLLRAGGGARLTAVATGLHRERRSETGLLLPPAPKAVARQVSGQALQVRPSPVTAELRQHPRRALLRRITRAAGPLLLLAIAFAACDAVLAPWWPAWPWITVLALTLLAVPLAVDRYRNLGHALTRNFLVSRTGSLRRSTVALRRSGIIGWTVRASFFQRRAGLVTVTATTAAGRGAYGIVDVDRTAGLTTVDAAVPGLLEPFLLREDTTVGSSGEL